MSSPLLVASTDASRQLLVLTVEGPLVASDEVSSLELVVPAVPVGYSLILDLTETTALGDDAVQALRQVARSATEAGLTMVVVCGDLERRTELVLADLDTLVPVVEALEQALPLTRAAA